ncbi:MAG: substrate-binding domain-containing protein [Scytolyngbya sp. HA4215-MV1]|jgi:hypothetical protein|nr:substrate-binding domain-containing protein [Scytolyngbya sp. HA4215-MV1]
MQKIAEVLLLTFLRRYPLPTRLSLFSYLGRYAWLKDVLEALRPELFPQRQEALAEEAPEAVLPPPDDSVLGILERGEIQGRVGYYKADTYLGVRGRGHLFSAIETTSKRPVIIKEYLLLAADFAKTEAYQRQNRFQRLAGLQLADGRIQDFRVIQPIEAIADTESHQRCFLVTDVRDRSATLRQHLQRVGTLSISQVREILSQILQTLDFLHKQKFSFPNGAIQNGLVHGNLSLDSILWTEQQSQPFVYLCDLRLWEQCFDPTVKDWKSSLVTSESLKKDLQAVGEIGETLLKGLDAKSVVNLEPLFQNLLDSLRAGRFSSAEAARQELLRLSPRSPTAISALDDGTVQPAPTRRVSPLLALSLMGLVVAALVLLPRLRSTESRSTPIPQVSTCCLSEVSAIPAGTYTYTAVEDGTWWTVLQQHDLLRRGRSLSDALVQSQPKLQLQFVAADSLDQALQQVRAGKVDFAVLPLMGELPADLLAQEIAYDGLVAVVSFSYAERQEGLPAALNGKLSLQQVQQLYEGKIDRWQDIGGPDLSVRRYASKNPEAIALFEQRVLKSNQVQRLSNVGRLPAISLFRQIIRDFEDNSVGSIGITTLSEALGQCSVYPLALSRSGANPVQPLVLSNGQAVNPETDLCNRKGAYGPEPQRFQTGSYPLSYPIMVVYPRDNRRSEMGKKFVELMRTVEGQRLLQAAGLVPLSQNLTKPASAAPPNGG